LLLPGTAWAADGSTTVLSHANIALGVSLLVGFCAAHAGSALVKLHAPQYLKATVTTVLAAAAGIIPTVVWADGASWTVYLQDVFAALAGQVLMHYIGATNWVAAKTSNFGLSANRPDPLGHTDASASR
jgi:hypothetical protein